MKVKRGRHAAPSTAMTVLAAAAPAVVLAGAAVVSSTGPQPALADTGSFPVTHDITSVRPAATPRGLVAHTAAAFRSVSLTARHARPSMYTVKSGDTLSGIAQSVYGNSGDWPGIYVDNKAVVPNPDLIYPGEHLHIPATGSSVGAPPPPVVVAYVPKHATPVPVQAAPVQAAPVQDSQVNPSDYSGFEECVVTRESGGDPTIVNAASGAGGLFQFLPSTWAALGFSGLPEDAPVSVQDEAFAKAFAEWGTSPWAPSDGC